MTKDDGQNVRTQGTVDDQKTDVPKVIDTSTPPPQIDRKSKTPSQHESYDNYLYRIRAPHTNAEKTMGGKKIGNHGHRKGL